MVSDILSWHVTEFPPNLICSNKHQGPGNNGNTYVAIFPMAYKLLDYCMLKAFHNGIISVLIFRNSHLQIQGIMWEMFHQLVIQILCKMLYALILTVIILSKEVAYFYLTCHGSHFDVCYCG